MRNSPCATVLSPFLCHTPFVFVVHRSAGTDRAVDFAAAPTPCSTGVRQQENPLSASGTTPKAASRMTGKDSLERIQLAAAAERRPLTQLHLDLGQVCFHLSVHLLTVLLTVNLQ